MSYQDLVKQNLPEKTKLIYLLPPSISIDIDGFEGCHQKLKELVNLSEKIDYQKTIFKSNSQLSYLQLDWSSVDSRVRENDKDTLINPKISARISFINLSDFKVNGADGLHFSLDDHKKVAEIVYNNLLLSFPHTKPSIGNSKSY